MSAVANNLEEVPRLAPCVAPLQPIAPEAGAIAYPGQTNGTEQNLPASEREGTGLQPEPESINEKQLAEVHSFSRKLAKEHGVAAAIILGYLANRVQAAEEKRKDGLGYFTSIRTLADHYPYLSLGRIADTLASLRKQGVLRAENHNKYKYDRKLWYTFADPQVQKDAGWDPIRFQVADAVNYGVLEAILLANIRYWIKENRKETPDYTWHRISARTLAKHLPFCYKTIARALDNLVKFAAVERQKCQGLDHAFKYRLALGEIHDGTNPEMDGTNPNIDGTISDIDGTNPEMDGTQVEMDGTNPNNDIILKDSIEKTSLKSSPCEDRVGESTFITPSAAPSESCACLHTRSPDNITKEVIESNNLPIPAEGPHSQVAAPEIESVRTSDSSSETEDFAHKYLKRPVDYVSPLVSGELSTHVSGSSNCRQINHTSAPQLSVVPSSPPWSISGSDSFPSAEGVVAPSSPSVQSTSKLNDLPSVSPFKEMKVVVPSGYQESAWEKHVDAYRREQERLDQAEKARRQKQREVEQSRLTAYEDLWTRYPSPYADQENAKSLTPEGKVRVLKAGLRCRLKIGAWSDMENIRYSCNFIFTTKGLEMARTFFELNPTVSACDLLYLMDACCERDHHVPDPRDGYDELFYVRRGMNLSFLLKHLPTINTKLDILCLPPGVVYLDEVDSKPGNLGSGTQDGLDHDRDEGN
jgi:hypothetical protein